MIKSRSEIIKLLELHKLAHLPAAEIGVAEGNYSRDLLNMGIRKLYMVDNWATIPFQKGDGGHPNEWHEANYQAALDKVKPFGDKAVILRGKSVEMAKQVPDESLGLVYLDASHNYEDVLADLSAWMPKLVRGGIMAGHDFLNEAYGVRRAVFEYWNEAAIHVIPENNENDASFYFIK